MRDKDIDSITPNKAMELLRKDGINVDDEQAKIILDFLYEMAEIKQLTKALFPGVPLF